MKHDDALALAMEWAGRELPAFPVAVSWDAAKGKTNKVPLTTHGFRDATTDVGKLTTMFNRVHVPEGADLAVGLWPGPANITVLDDDGGLATAGLVLPTTYTVTTASGGRHFWFRKLDDDVAIGNESPWSGIDIRSDNGYVMAPGSEVALRVGKEFALFSWVDPGGYTMRRLPQNVWNRLTRASSSTATDGWSDYDPEMVDPLTARAVTLFCSHLGGHHPRFVPGERPHVQITRPEKGRGTSATIGFVGPGVTKVFTSNWPGLREGMVLGLRELTDLLEGRRSADGHDALNLSSDVWESRPVLSTIRDAARARLVSPDAVLGAVLARVCAFTDHRIKLPPTVGSLSGLSLLVVLLGEPGTGKSAAWSVAAELVPVPMSLKIANDLKFGSGEGWVEALLELREQPREEGEKGKVKLKKEQIIYNALGWIDEGSRLSTSKARAATALSETLRSIFSDQALGETNASVETHRAVPKGQYVYGVGMGLQPALAADLLSGASAGDPQRWAWVWCHDPGYTEGHEWDGRPLAWSPQTFEAHPTRRTQRGTGGWITVLISLPVEVEAEIRANRIAKLRANGDADAMEAHADLLRLKVAEAFALLDGRLDLDVEDWSLAGRYVELSGRVRAHAAEVANEQQAGVQRARRESRVADAAAIDDAAIVRANLRGAKAIARSVWRENGRTRNEAMRATKGTDRKVGDFYEMVAVAASNRWIVDNGDRLERGDVDPE